MSTVSRITEVIRAGAESLLGQHKYSNGYFSQGASEIAEQNLIVHVAHSFLADTHVRKGGRRMSKSANHAVWAESPFKTPGSNEARHLDLFIDFDLDSENSTVLTIEGKRITPGEENKKIREIIDDFDRIKSYRTLPPEGLPLFLSLAQPIEWFYGALIVIVRESYDEAAAGFDNSFVTWWQNLKGLPPKYAPESIDTLRQILQAADEDAKGFIDGCYRDKEVHLDFDWETEESLPREQREDAKKLSVVYAIFDFGPGPGEENLLKAKHKSAHAVVAARLGLPVHKTSIRPGDEPLGCDEICDWESLLERTMDASSCENLFAIAFAGAAMEMQLEPDRHIEEILIEFSEDSDTVMLIRKHLAVVKAPSADQTEKDGLELAVRLVKEETSRIERLAHFLLEKVSLTESEILDWFNRDSLKERPPG